MNTEKNTVVTATKKEYTAHIKQIKKELQGVEKSFIRTALMLYWIDVTDAYTYGDYNNIVEMAEKEFNFSKSTCYNFINIVKDFGAIDAETQMCDELKEEYAGYSSTQLIAMHGCTIDELNAINDTMSVRQIKALIKAMRTKAIEQTDTDEESEEIEEIEEEPTDTPLNTSPIQAHNTQSLFSITSIEELENKKDEMLNIIRKTLEQGEQYSVLINMMW